MLATWLELVTNSWTLKVTKLFNFLLRHYSLLLIKRIIHLVTEKFTVLSVASALFDNRLLTLHTLVGVALLNALVGATGQVSLTECFTGRYRLSAHKTLSPNKFFNWVVAWWTVLHTLGVSRTRCTFIPMTLLFTVVLAAVQRSLAYTLTRESISATHCLYALSTTKAFDNF
jgi:hypothetical protein